MPTFSPLPSPLASASQSLGGAGGSQPGLHPPTKAAQTGSKNGTERRLRDRFPPGEYVLAGEALTVGPGRIRKLRALANRLRFAVPEYRERRMQAAIAAAIAMRDRALNRAEIEREAAWQAHRSMVRAEMERRFRRA